MDTLIPHMETLKPIDIKFINQIIHEMSQQDAKIEYVAPQYTFTQTL